MMILVEGLLDLPIAYLIIAPAMSAFDAARGVVEGVRGVEPANAGSGYLPILRPAILAATRPWSSSAWPPCRSLAVIGMPGRDVRPGHPTSTVSSPPGLSRTTGWRRPCWDERSGRLHHPHHSLPSPGRKEKYVTVSAGATGRL